MKIWDTFLYAGESDMLECRLRELSGYADVFVIAEADRTHQGDPKPLSLLDNQERFKPWLHRIRYLPVGTILGEGTWERENRLRDWLIWGMRGVSQDDIILHGDVDEIPDLAGWLPGNDITVFAQRHAMFAADWLREDLWPGTIAAPWGSFATFQGLRAQRFDLPRRGGGWHLSWLGGPEAIRQKNHMIAHLEHVEMIDRANDAGLLYEQGYDPWEAGQLKAAEVDETWPRWISGRDCPAAWFRPR